MQTNRHLPEHTRIGRFNTGTLWKIPTTLGFVMFISPEPNQHLWAIRRRCICCYITPGCLGAAWCSKPGLGGDAERPSSVSSGPRPNVGGHTVTCRSLIEDFQHILLQTWTVLSECFLYFLAGYNFNHYVKMSHRPTLRRTSILFKCGFWLFKWLCFTHWFWFSSSMDTWGSSDLTRVSDVASMNSLRGKGLWTMRNVDTLICQNVSPQSSSPTLQLRRHSPSSRVLCLLSFLQERHLCNKCLASYFGMKQNIKLLKTKTDVQRTHVPLCRSYSLFPLMFKLSGILAFPTRRPLAPPLPLRSESTL